MPRHSKVRYSWGMTTRNPTYTAGNTFGRWTITTGQYIDDRIHVTCTCGTTKLVRRQALKTGRTTSCGCHRAQRLTGKTWNPNLAGTNRQYTQDDLKPGNTIWSWTITSDPYLHNKHRVIHAQCTCGTQRTIRTNDLLNNHNKSCGCYRQKGATQLHQQ